jgi:hypothetical protein
MKVIKYFCDKCKEDITNHQTIYQLIHPHRIPGIMGDYCRSCYSTIDLDGIPNVETITTRPHDNQEFLKHLDSIYRGSNDGK